MSTAFVSEEVAYRVSDGIDFVYVCGCVCIESLLLHVTTTVKRIGVPSNSSDVLKLVMLVTVLYRFHTTIYEEHDDKA